MQLDALQAAAVVILPDWRTANSGFGLVALIVQGKRSVESVQGVLRLCVLLFTSAMHADDASKMDALLLT